MRVVLDTDVVAAAMRSPSGASSALLQAALDGRIQLLANVALILEYEAVCKREEHLLAAGLDVAQAGIFVDAVAALAEPVESHFIWKAAAERLAREEGISMNQFVATAVAEKLAAMQTASFFDERRQRADLAAFRKLLKRARGDTPRDGDER